MPLRTVGIGDRARQRLLAGIVFLVITDAAIVIAVDAAGDGVEFAVFDTDGMMIPRCDHGCVLAPKVLSWIVGFVGRRVAAILADPADGVDFSRDDADGESAACGWHRFLRRPLIFGRSVFIDGIQRTDAGNIAADDVNLAVERGRADVMQWLWQGGAAAPTIGCRVVLLDQMAAFIVTPNDVNLAAEFHRCDLGARRRHGRAGDPFAGQLGRRVGRECNGHEEAE